MSEPGKIGTANIQVSRSASIRAKAPKGYRISFEDDLIEVYDNKGKRVESGLYDYSSYRHEDYKWNEKDQNYDLPNGYKMVGLTKH